jgi:hypothetical protein
MRLLNFDHVGCYLNDLPQRAFGALVVDAATVIWAFFFQHAEADEPTEFLAEGALRGNFAGGSDW